MKTNLRAGVAILTLFLSFALVPAAFAHPLGNFTINQFVGLAISRETIHVDYVVDMAEIPAFQELAPYDSDGDRQPDLPAIQTYPAEKCASLQPDLKLTLNREPLTLTLTSSAVEFPMGVGGLPTLRLSCEFQSAIIYTGNTRELSFVNNAFPDRLGWKEIVVFADRLSLQGEFATTSLSNRLTNYPQDLLTSPPDQRGVELTIVPAVSPLQDTSVMPVSEAVPSLADRNDEFTRLILLEDFTLPTLLLALAISFVWGAAHAMTPGHGKTIVGAYLVGSRGTIKHAVYLGLTTTITHTLGVFALGLVTLFAAQYILPETLFPWLSLLSGLFVVGIGVNLFASRFKSSGIGARFNTFKPVQPHSPLAFSSMQIEPFTASHNHAFVHVSPPQHSHSHSSGHYHEHHDVHHSPNREDAHTHAHDKDHAHDGHVHQHSDADHSHMPPEALTWRSLLALGVSGGLIPCPSALVVLLGAIALNKIGFGLILVLAFSLGLAGALTAIGIAFIYAGRLFKRIPAGGRVANILPVFSALFISLIGLGMVLKAIVEIGV